MCPLKTRTVKPEKTVITREKQVDTFPWQRIHKRDNRGTVVGGVFHAVSAEGIQGGQLDNLYTPPCSGGYKYRDLALQFGRVSNLRQ
jgi:hypothetical protein